MKDRLSANDNGETESEMRKEAIAFQSAEDSVKRLEGYVKNGLFFQAAELSDWIGFRYSEMLANQVELAMRFDIERLKRFDYLGYAPETEVIRDAFCRKYDLQSVLSAPAERGLDATCFYLFTAIGHPLWRIEDLQAFDVFFGQCQRLFDHLSCDFEFRELTRAFLLALEGRRSFLKGNPITDIVAVFDNAVAAMPPALRGARAGLHLLAHFARHLISLYERGLENQELSDKIDGILADIDRYRLTHLSVDGSPTPAKTLLCIDFLVMSLRKKKLDQKYLSLVNSGTGGSTALNLEIERLHMELLFTSQMLGLGNLNPAPPIVGTITSELTAQQRIYDVKQVQSYLKGVMEQLDWQAMERVVRIFFESRNYKVIDLPGNTPAFDLILEIPIPGVPYRDYIAVQVKNWSKKFLKADFDDWVSLFEDFTRNHPTGSSITSIYLVTKRKVSSGVTDRNNLDSLRQRIPSLRSQVEFFSLDDIVKELWRTQGCLPEIYAVVSGSRG